MSILQGCNHCFPKYLWCQLLPQSVLTLNLLRKSRILSAHKQVFGSFNYQQTPLGWLGTLVIIHKTDQPSWAAHGKEGFLVDRAKDHYHSYKVSMKNTSGTQTSDAIEFLPTKYNIPKTSSQDRIIASLEEIAETITNPKYRKPFLNGNKGNEIFDKLAEIFTAYKKNDKEETKKGKNQNNI